MRTTAALSALVMAMATTTTTAQLADRPAVMIDLLAPAPQAPANLDLAGALLEKAGRQGTAATWCAIGGAFVATMATTTDADNALPGVVIGGLAGVASITLRLASDRNTRKAGKALRN